VPPDPWSLDQPPSRSVPCACVLVSPLYYKPSVKLRPAHYVGDPLLMTLSANLSRFRPQKTSEAPSSCVLNVFDRTSFIDWVCMPFLWLWALISSIPGHNITVEGPFLMTFPLISPVPGHNITVGGAVILCTNWFRSYPIHRLSVHALFDEVEFGCRVVTTCDKRGGGRNSLYIICLCIYMTSARQTHDASSDI